MTDNYRDNPENPEEVSVSEDSYQDAQAPVDDFSDNAEDVQVEESGYEEQPMEEASGEEGEAAPVEENANQGKKPSKFIFPAAVAAIVLLAGGLFYFQFLSGSEEPVRVAHVTPPAPAATPTLSPATPATPDATAANTPNIPGLVPAAPAAAPATPAGSDVAVDIAALQNGAPSTPAAQQSAEIPPALPPGAVDALIPPAPQATTQSTVPSIPSIPNVPGLDTSVPPAPTAAPATVPVAAAVPLAAHTPPASSQTDIENQARIAALNAQVASLQKSLDNAMGMVNDLQAGKPLNTVDATSASDEPKAIKASSVKKSTEKRATNKKTTKAQKTAKAKAAKVASAPSWVLRAAVPGEAWVAVSMTSQDLRHVRLGDNLPGIGRVTDILPVGDGWLVQGTQGSIR